MRGADMDNLQHALGAIVRHLDLLGWHVKQLRETGSGTVAEEVDGGLAAVKEAVAELGDDNADGDEPCHGPQDTTCASCGLGR